MTGDINAQLAEFVAGRQKEADEGTVRDQRRMLDERDAEIARLQRELAAAKAADQGWGEIDRPAREERDRVRLELEAEREKVALLVNQYTGQIDPGKILAALEAERAAHAETRKHVREYSAIVKKQGEELALARRERDEVIAAATEPEMPQTVASALQAIANLASNEAAYRRATAAHGTDLHAWAEEVRGLKSERDTALALLRECRDWINERDMDADESALAKMLARIDALISKMH